MRDTAWIYKANLMLIAFIFIIFVMTKMQSGSVQKFIAGVFAPGPQTQTQEAGR